MTQGVEFSAKSFRQIAELEVRKGRPDPGSLFPSIQTIINESKQATSDRRSALRAEIDPDALAQIRADYRVLRNAIRTRKTSALLDQLDRVSARVAAAGMDGTFTWGIHDGPVARGRQTFQIQQTIPDVFFAAKQLEHSLRRSSYEPPPSRNLLVSQLISSLSNGMPKMLIKADITTYFESIPHDGLSELLIENHALSTLATTFLQKFLDEWRSLSASTTGLPRGVGISSQLAEIYLQSLDRKMRATPGVTYYARYVDDLVLVISSDSEQELEKVYSQLVVALDELGLALNESKTQKRTSDGQGGLNGNFDFLGYEFRARQGGLVVSFSPKKIARYEARIDTTLAAWALHPAASTGYQGLLLHRWQFLMGNTKLANNKRNALTGVYFSNPHLNDDKVLKALDKYAQQKLGLFSVPQPLHARMSALSFSEGFKNKTMHRFTQNELTRIVAAWKNV